MTLYRKIDLYRVHRRNGRIIRTEYICSTNWSKTIKEAVARFHEINGADSISGRNIVPLNSEIKGQFS